MVVLKLGGSLSQSPQLAGWVDYFAECHPGQAVIVPGGGVFAELVRKMQRQWQFNGRNAHHMAVLGMQQMALLLQGINTKMALASSINKIRQCMDVQQPVIWFPDMQCLNLAGIPATWDITSDSLAAWLASNLMASELVLVKSAPIPSSYTLLQLTEQGVVDRAFCRYAGPENYTVRLFHRDDLSLFKKNYSEKI